MLTNFKKQIADLIEKYGTHLEVLFFVFGIIIDMVFLSEIDDLFSILQQVVYLFIIAALIHYELLFRMHKWKPRSRMLKVWEYRNLIMHFLLGSLLNLYSLFYIKSSSLFSSLIFLIFMAALVLGNELPVVKNAKVSFKFGMYAICLYSFMAILFPILLGFVGWLPFVLSVVAAGGIFYLQIRILRKNLLGEVALVRAMLLPGYSVLSVFVIFYFMGWIPPVPISVKEQGIYHMIEKKDGNYLLSTEKNWWEFWRSGDQYFKAEPGDKIYFYAQIYSPARFSDQVFIRWLWKNNLGEWQSTDRIPMGISGGRAAGYRGYTTKSNYQPGEWQVRVETASEHEISRLSFEVENVQQSAERVFEVIQK